MEKEIFTVLLLPETKIWKKLRVKSCLVINYFAFSH